MLSIRSAILCSWLLFVMSAVAAPAAYGEVQASEPAEPLEPWALLKSLEGTWEGEVDGRLGKGKGVRTYELILRDRYLLSRHRSVRLPQDKSPEGDQHEELGVFSFDKERDKIVYREFMIEGMVIRSPCEVEDNRIECVSEAVESGPGIRARLTLDILDPYRFTETYHLGFSGREPEHYLTVQWTRSPLPFAWR